MPLITNGIQLFVIIKMNRLQFLKILGILPLSGLAMKLNELSNLTQAFSSSEKM